MCRGLGALDGLTRVLAGGCRADGRSDEAFEGEGGERERKGEEGENTELDLLFTFSSSTHHPPQRPSFAENGGRALDGRSVHGGR